MLKWILIAVALLVVGGCTIVVGGAYWAYTSVKATPEFYEQVEAVELTPEEQTEAIEDVRELAMTVVPSLAFEENMQKREVPEVEGNESAESPIVASEPEGREIEENNLAVVERIDGEQTSGEQLDSERIDIELDERTLNTYAASLMAEAMKRKQPFSDVRIQLNDGVARIGFRLTTPDFEGVGSIDVEPQIVDAKSVAFVFRRVAMGNLAIPLEQAMTSADIETSDLPEGITIPPNARPPRIECSWEHLAKIATEIDSLSVVDGKLTASVIVPKGISIERASKDSDHTVEDAAPKSTRSTDANPDEKTDIVPDRATAL